MCWKCTAFCHRGTLSLSIAVELEEEFPNVRAVSITPLFAGLPLPFKAFAFTGLCAALSDKSPSSGSSRPSSKPPPVPFSSLTVVPLPSDAAYGPAVAFGTGAEMMCGCDESDTTLAVGYHGCGAPRLMLLSYKPGGAFSLLPPWMLLLPVLFDTVS